MADQESQIKNRIRQFIWRGESLLQQVESSKGTTITRAELADDRRVKLVGELAGLLDIGIKRDTTKHLRSHYRQKRDEEKKQIEDQQTGNISYWISEMETYFTNISIQKPNLTKKGNSQQILKKLSQLYKHKKLETKLRNGIGILKELQYEELIHNTAIQEKPLVNKHDYDLLKTIENKLRNCIQTQLSTLTPNWWKERIPSDVRNNAEKRKKDNETLWPWANTTQELIYYVDFNDYFKIITKRDNWREAFSAIFIDIDLLTAKLKELDPIRNSIAHNRSITETDRLRLKLAAHDILTCIEN